MWNHKESVLRDESSGAHSSTTNLIMYLKYLSSNRGPGVHLSNVLTHLDRQAFTPTDKLESPINRTCMSLDCGGKPEQTWGKHADATQKDPRLHQIYQLESG